MKVQTGGKDDKSSKWSVGFTVVGYNGDRGNGLLLLLLGLVFSLFFSYWVWSDGKRGKAGGEC